ncbi:MAG TPA: O-antigen ligase family protein [Streptosporangiaceae bacterium]
MIGKKTIMPAGGDADAGPGPLRPARIVGALAIAATPVAGYAILRHERLGIEAVAAALIALLALVRPAAALAALVPVTIVEATLSGGSTARPIQAAALVALSLVLRAALRAAAPAAGPAAGPAGTVPDAVPGDPRVDGEARGGEVRDGEVTRPLRPAHLWIGLLGGLLVISARFPAIRLQDGSAAADLGALLVGLALLAAVTAVAPRPSVIIRTVAGAGALAAGYALVFGVHDGGRLAAFGLNPNYLGGMLALPCVAAAGLAWLRRNPAWLAPAAACLTAIITTQSRGAFLSAAAGIAVVVVQGRGRRARWRFALAAGAAGVAIALAAPAGGGLGLVEQVAAGNREHSELAYDTTVRGDVAEFAMKVAARHPVRGIGYAAFPSYAATAPDFGIYMATHDDYLRLAAEAGGIALGAFLVLLWLGVRGRRHGELAVARAVTVAYAVGLVFANPLGNLLVSLPFWLSLGCLLAVRPDGERRETRRQER